MIYIIDHRDSFTWNIVHMLEVFEPVTVIDYAELDGDSIPETALAVISPGPGTPADYPVTLEWCRRLSPRQPVLGICLGFQMLLYVNGARIMRQEQVLHGVSREISFDAECATYTGLQAPIIVGRYHALVVDKQTIPVFYRVTATDFKSFIPLSIEHLTLPQIAVQYHPDSFLTNHGGRIFANIYRELGRRRQFRSVSGALG